MKQQPGQRSLQGFTSCALLLLGFTLPFLGFFIGWYWWDFDTGVTVAAVGFALFVIIVLGVALFSESISWLVAALPFVSSVVYTISPDFIPGFVDDVIVLLAGAFVSLILLIRKLIPRTILFSLLITGIYAYLAGDWLPGLVDEAAVFLVVFLFMLVLGRRQQLNRQQMQ